MSCMESGRVVFVNNNERDATDAASAAPRGTLVYINSLELYKRMLRAEIITIM